MLVGGVVVEHRVDQLAGRDLALDGIEETDELAVALYAAPPSPRNQLCSSINEPAFPSRPGTTPGTARSVGDGRSGATRSAREHGEHRTFPAVSTVAG
jgi:hypothetical protein